MPNPRSNKKMPKTANVKKSSQTADLTPTQLAAVEAFINETGLGLLEDVVLYETHDGQIVDIPKAEFIEADQYRAGRLTAAELTLIQSIWPNLRWVELMHGCIRIGI